MVRPMRIVLYSDSISTPNCHDIALFLDESNIAVRSGVLCAHSLIQSISDDGIIQASIHAYNSLEDIDRLADTIAVIAAELL